jgi:sRNA-binding regulator protein Hfq
MDEMRWHRPPAGAPHSDGADREPEPVLTEGEYLHDLAQSAKPVVMHLRSGEIFRGTIEYYDQRFIRLTRKGEPNLFIFKQDIKYFYEE